MLPNPFDLDGYFFWLLAISLLCWLLERARPWRRQQRALRADLGQDALWLLFNGHYAPVWLGTASAWALYWAADYHQALESLRLIAGLPSWAQFAIALLVKDLCEWLVHNLLHRVPWLWELHKVHHSILELDWIGNFRFHWMELVVYSTLTYAPPALLGTAPEVLFAVGVFSTLIGHLNHSNLDLSWGPLRYVFNSPRMHVWHHAERFPAAHPKGANFGIVLSCWDWLAGTAWWPDVQNAPEQQPERLGFPGLAELPKSWLGRCLHPLPRLWSRLRSDEA